MSKSKTNWKLVIGGLTFAVIAAQIFKPPESANQKATRPTSDSTEDLRLKEFGLTKSTATKLERDSQTACHAAIIDAQKALPVETQRKTLEYVEASVKNPRIITGLFQLTRPQTGERTNIRCTVTNGNLTLSQEGSE